MISETAPNKAMERTADPRHASCVRTCRASGRGPLIADVGAGRRSSCVNSGKDTSSSPNRGLISLIVCCVVVACSGRPHPDLTKDLVDPRPEDVVTVRADVRGALGTMTYVHFTCSSGSMTRILSGRAFTKTDTPPSSSFPQWWAPHGDCWLAHDEARHIHFALWVHPLYTEGYCMTMN
jgi:hypothetical protein